MLSCLRSSQRHDVNAIKSERIHVFYIIHQRNILRISDSFLPIWVHVRGLNPCFVKNTFIKAPNEIVRNNIFYWWLHSKNIFVESCITYYWILSWCQMHSTSFASFSRDLSGRVDRLWLSYRLHSSFSS